MDQEIELKLAIDSRRAGELWPLLAARQPGVKRAAQSLFTAYYDTPDLDLKKAGVALRLRHDRGRWIQAVKHAGIASGGLHQRTEHETEVAAQLPHLPAMEDAGIGELVANAGVRDNLQVVFTTEFTRTSALLGHPGDVLIEVALDEGQVVAQQRREPICEVELELKAGDPLALFELALFIAAALPVRLDNRSKAERGYALAANARPAPVKASRSSLRPDMEVPGAFATLAMDALAHLQANERGLLDGRNHEYLHQARVALRRLRSVFHAFEPVVPLAQFGEPLEYLRRLAATLGEARNLDVFLTETLPRAGSGTHPGLAALKRRAMAARRAANRAAREAIGDPEYVQQMLGLTFKLLEVSQCTPGAGERTLQTFAADALEGARTRVKKRGRKLRSRDYDELHRLRIAIKRLRYALEFFEPLVPGGDDERQALSGLQDRLGRMNDDATAWKLLDRLSVVDISPDFQQAVGYLRGWTARDGEACRDALPKAWKRYKKPSRG